MSSDTVFDTHEIARSLTDADLTPAQADAITAAVRRAAEHGEHVSPAMLRAELSALEARLAWRLIGAGIAIAGIQAAALFTLLRLVGSGS